MFKWIEYGKEIIVFFFIWVIFVMNIVKRIIEKNIIVFIRKELLFYVKSDWCNYLKKKKYV